MERDFIGQPRPRVTPRSVPQRVLPRVDDRSRFRRPLEVATPTPQAQSPAPLSDVVRSPLEFVQKLPKPDPVVEVAPSAPLPPPTIKPEPFASPAEPRQQNSQVLNRAYVKPPVINIPEAVENKETFRFTELPKPKLPSLSSLPKLPSLKNIPSFKDLSKLPEITMPKHHIAAIAIGAILIISGIFVGASSLLGGNNPASKANALSKSNASTAKSPSEVMPTTTTINSYAATPTRASNTSNMAFPSRLQTSHVYGIAITSLANCN